MSTDVLVVIGPASRELRRSLRPIEWVVLEDVALDARRDDDGVLMASTSARQVAGHLGLTPGAVARALSCLRSAGLVSHARQLGPAGRFGLSAYVLGPVPGLEVIHAAAASPVLPPRAARPHVESPRVADRHMADEAPGASDAVASEGRPDRRPERTHTTAPTADGDELDADGALRRRVAARRRSAPAGQLSLLDVVVDRSAKRTP